MTPKLDVRLVSCSKYPNGDPETSDFAAFLNARNVAADVVAWDADVDWAASKLCVIRSAWDYHRQLDKFLDWCSHVSSRTELWNPASLIRWNSHKQYLLELERRGIPIVPTRVVRRGRRTDLQTAATAWRSGRDFVVKHAVSLDGEGLLRTSTLDSPVVLDLLEQADVLIQPYVSTVAEEGEVSAVFIDGEFVHGVRKRAAPGEFRVQERYGGRTEGTVMESAFQALARRVMDLVSEPTLYARVDMVRWGDQPRLGELELIEPSLYLRAAPDSRMSLLAAILKRLKPS